MHIAMEMGIVVLLVFYRATETQTETCHSTDGLLIIPESVAAPHNVQSFIVEVLDAAMWAQRAHIAAQKFG